ncbi:MAG: hypothetical protein K9N49_09365 [Candidatus Marinimicrobia bacterium]|nr:hypothetical protein [Candidatus Neomarinimicrobiota bacterium]
MKSPFKAMAGWAVLGAMLLGAAGSLLPDLQRRRELAGLVPVTPFENAPPLVAFTTVALGGFRGLIADALWVRASRLQNEGKYFELVQLADWITKLEPRFTEVWAWQGWNLAYNISVLFPAPEDRWRWVSAGIELLRDRGLRYNPGSSELFRELGWLFQHKVGGQLDQAHWYYKRQWAENMRQCFDGPRPDYEAWEALPATRAALEAEPEVAAALADLRAAGRDPFAAPPPLAEAAAADPLWTTPGAARLRAFLQRARLREVYRLEPDIMRALETDYGPLDWRLYQAHAVYWAYRGRPFAREFGRVQIDRMIFQSLAEAFRYGRLFIEPEQDVFLSLPNLDVLPWVRRAYEEALTEHPEQDAIRTAYVNFLREALVTTYSYARNSESRALYDRLRELEPATYANRSFEDHVFAALTEELGDLNPRTVLALFEGALYQSYFWLAAGEAEQAAGFRQMAQLIRREYRRIYDSAEQQERMGLPPLARIERQAFEQARAAFEGAAARARLEAAAPPPGGSAP